MNSVITPAILVFLSAVSYTLPEIWLPLRNPLYSSIIVLTNGILLLLYSLLFHQDNFDNINRDTSLKMILTGIFIFFSWALYLEALTYKKYSILSTQYIYLFIVSIIIAFFVLGSKITLLKAIGVIVAVIGISLIIIGETNGHIENMLVY